MLPNAYFIQKRRMKLLENVCKSATQACSIAVVQSAETTSLTLTLAFRRVSSPWTLTREESSIVFTLGICTTVRLASRRARYADLINTFVGEWNDVCFAFHDSVADRV